MTRKEAREFMMQVFFQMEACGDFSIDHRADYFNEDRVGDQRGYCSDLFSLLCNKHAEIDALLDRHSPRWKLSRMPKTDLAVLRLAVCEIVYLTGIPHAVTINEAVELAKRYGTADSHKYVNAILGRISAESQAAHA